MSKTAKLENKEIVADAKARIEALESDTANKNRFALIEQTYETVLEIAF